MIRVTLPSAVMHVEMRRAIVCAFLKDINESVIIEVGEDRAWH
jgi:hypothetical protein